MRRLLWNASRTVNGISAESPSCFWFRSAAEVSARDRGRPQTAATHQMRQRGPRLGRDVMAMPAKGQRLGRGLPAAGSRRGCRTNQHHPRLLVRLPQGHDFGRAISVAESPVRPAGSLSRGQPKWLLSNSYKGFGLSDSLRPEHQSARGPSALSLSGFGCLPVVADPSNAGVLESVGSADREPEARIAGRLLGNAKAASGRVSSVSLVRESGHLDGADSSTAGRRRGGSGQRCRGNCRSAPSDIRPARISGLGKYGKRFPACRRSRRAGRETRIAGISERL
jgi:hypothetical protein